MKPIHILAALTASAALAGNALALQNNGGLGASDDCYNRVSQACAVMYPGKDMGDAGYARCINDGMDNCDVNEPALSHGGVHVGPVFGVKPGTLSVSPTTSAPTTTVGPIGPMGRTFTAKRAMR